MTHLLLPGRALFLCDTHVNEDPDAEQLADITLMAVEAVRRFKIRPKVALLSHSNFGSSRSPASRKVSDAVALVRERAPGLEVDGEMHGESALSEAVRDQSDPESLLAGEANVLVMPNLDAANISYNRKLIPWTLSLKQRE
jgi:malate dehydrogenase (oxaloacetate-decarboxylating)(NADP+)